MTRDGCEIMDHMLNVIMLLIAQGDHPKLYQLNNETKNKLKTLLKLTFIEFQLVPPNNHRCDAAKQAIQTWKANLISTLCSFNLLFPLDLWCPILAHIDNTLNHLSASKLNPQLFVYHPFWTDQL